MPEEYTPVGSRSRGRVYTIGEAARDNMFIVVKCTACRRCVHFLAADLVEVLGTGRPAMEPFCRCRNCKTAEYMRVDTRSIHPGDAGKLVIRRPSKPRL